MKTLFRIVLTLIAVSSVAFLFRVPLTQFLLNLENSFLPCTNPITYSLGSFDTRFNISKEKFIRIIDIAEKTWEKSINKDLFSFVSGGDLKINLIFDDRQEATQKLKDIGITVDESKASYNDLKSRYNVMFSEYSKLKGEFESRVITFQDRQNVYQKEVEFFNKKGGASKKDYDRLTAERVYLDTEFSEINKLQTTLDSKLNNVNALVIVLNSLISSLNIEVNKFNTIGEELGGEFEEGTYKESSDGREIDIYQFDDEGKLARVLAHEFGHALGLDHIENSKAVMYRLNNGINEKLTVDDIKALKNICKIQ